MTASPAGQRLTVVIVDDEPLAREGLAAAVTRMSATAPLPALDVVAQCENAIRGVEEIRRLTPDILLLDISMPEIDGFAMLERLEPEETPAAVIFVTAYSEHALRAFGAEALDYVVKPVPDARLRGALERAAIRIAERRLARAQLDALTAVPPPAKSGYLQQLTIPARDRHIVVPVRDIEWIQGDTYYVRVHVAPRERLLRERLHVLEQQLDPAYFYRTHRSAIVRLAAVREIRQDSPYSCTVTLASGARAPLARDRRSRLEALLAAPR